MMKRVLSTAAALLLAAGLIPTAGCEKNNLNKQGNEGPSAQKAGNPSEHAGENGAGAANKQTVAGQASPNSQSNPRYGDRGLNTDRKDRDKQQALASGAPSGAEAPAETNGELDRNTHGLAQGGNAAPATANGGSASPGKAWSSGASQSNGAAPNGSSGGTSPK